MSVIYPNLNPLRRIIEKVLLSSLPQDKRVVIHTAATNIGIKRTQIRSARLLLAAELGRYRTQFTRYRANPRVYPFELSLSLLKIAMYVEFVYYLTSSIFDISTQITKELYHTSQSQIPWPSFTEQLDWFLSNNVDSQYASRLRRIEPEYRKFKARRDGMTHFVASLQSGLTPSEPIGLFQRSRRVPVTVAVGDACNLLYRFLRTYDTYFSAKL
jgi:hypothetical protein